MQSGIGSDVELKEPVGVFLGEVGLWYHLKANFRAPTCSPGTRLFRSSSKVGLIQLHQVFQDLLGPGEDGFGRHIVPQANGRLGELGQAHGLAHRNLGSPAPQNHPELFQGKLEVGKPGVRQQGEANATFPTAISFLGGIHRACFTHGAIHIDPKDNTAQVFPDLCIRWYLVELVHIHISYMVCATPCDYPIQGT